MADVFLSYSRRDREVALRLHAALVERGKEVWIDEEDIPPTARWRDDLRIGSLAKPGSSRRPPNCRQRMCYAAGSGRRSVCALPAPRSRSR